MSLLQRKIYFYITSLPYITSHYTRSYCVPLQYPFTLHPISSPNAPHHSSRSSCLSSCLCTTDPTLGRQWASLPGKTLHSRAAKCLVGQNCTLLLGFLSDFWLMAHFMRDWIVWNESLYMAFSCTLNISQSSKF